MPIQVVEQFCFLFSLLLIYPIITSWRESSPWGNIERLYLCRKGKQAQREYSGWCFSSAVLSMRSYQAVVRGLPVQHSLRKRGQEIHSIFSPPNTVFSWSSSLAFIFGLPCTSSVDTPTYNYNCFRMFWGGLNKMLPEIILLKSKRSGFILVQRHWTWNPVASSTISSEMIWWTSNTKWRGDLAGQKASGKAAWVVTKMFRSFPHNREELLII